jgi:hypothetical protein
VYTNQKLKKKKHENKKKKKTTLIVLRVASESIWIMNEIEDLNKTNCEVCKNNGNKLQNMLYMMNIYCKNENNINKTSFKVDVKNRPIYDKLSLNLEPKVRDVQMS